MSFYIDRLKKRSIMR